MRFFSKCSQFRLQHARFDHVGWIADGHIVAQDVAVPDEVSVEVRHLEL